MVSGTLEYLLGVRCWLIVTQVRVWLDLPPFVALFRTFQSKMGDQNFEFCHQGPLAFSKPQETFSGHPSPLLHSGGDVQRSVKIALCSFSQNVVGTFLCRFRFPFRILEGIVNPRKPQSVFLCVCFCLFVPDLKIMSSVRIVWFSTSWISRKHSTQKTFPHSLPRPVRKTCLVRHPLVL